MMDKGTKRLIEKKLGKNDHVYQWREITRTTFLGGPRELKKALWDYFEDEIESPTGGTFMVEIHSGSVSVEQTIGVTIHSAEW